MSRSDSITVKRLAIRTGCSFRNPAGTTHSAWCVVEPGDGGSVRVIKEFDTRDHAASYAAELRRYLRTYDEGLPEADSC